MQSRGFGNVLDPFMALEQLRRLGRPSQKPHSGSVACSAPRITTRCSFSHWLKFQGEHGHQCHEERGVFDSPEHSLKEMDRPGLPGVRLGSGRPSGWPVHVYVHALVVLKLHCV